MRMYPALFRHGLSRLEAELAHEVGYDGIRLARKLGVSQVMRRWCAPEPDAARVVMGVRFPSPFGLAAGFDKTGKAVTALGDLGFGHIEVGTVTARAQSGNPKPRLFRLVDDRAVINRMGFNNDGARAVAERLARVRSAGAHARTVSRRVIGVSIGKSRATPAADAVADYVESTRHLAPVADYLAVNVSSPNTPGLRDLQEASALARIVTAVVEAAGESAGRTVPVVVKLAPELDDDDLKRSADAAADAGAHGLVAVNTTSERDGLGLTAPAAQVRAIGAGGLSGRPLREQARHALCVLDAHLGGEIALISSGGITTGADAAERLGAGAALVQAYTAFLYEGPLWARAVNRGLEARLPTSTSTSH